MFKYLRHGFAAVALLAACMTQGLKAQVVLSIDRDTGSATIRNDSDSAQVNFDGYSIASENGLLNSVGWTSFADLLIAGWEEAPTSNSNGLAEFNSALGGFVTLGPSQTASIGNAYSTDVAAAMSAVGFGNDFEDLVFSIADDTTNEVVAGSVEYTGQERFNNLVLEINPASGNAQLVNESPESVTIDFYQITSPSDVLLPSFSGLTQGGSPVAGWESGGANTANGLAQFFPQPAAGFTIVGGEVFDLGAAFQPGDSARDVDLLFRIVGGSDLGFDGEVRFVTASALAGDFNNDGLVNAADYTVWRDNLDAMDESLINNAGDGSGVVDQADYDLWAANFGASSAPATAVGVPEPSTALLGVVGAASLFFNRRLARCGVRQS